MSLWRFSKENAPIFHRIIENIEKDLLQSGTTDIKNEFHDVFDNVLETKKAVTNEKINATDADEQMEIISISSNDSLDLKSIENTVNLTVLNEKSASTSAILTQPDNVQDVVKCYIDTLENGEKLNEDDINYLNNIKFQDLYQIFDQFKEISSKGIFNLTSSLCQTAIILKNEIFKKLCDTILIPSMSDSVKTESSEKSLMTLIEFKKEEIDFICDEILLPLVQQQEKASIIVSSVVKTLNEKQQQHFLRKILTEKEKEEKLTSYDFSLVQSLFSSNTEHSLTRLVITAMYNARKTLNKDKVFGKLVSRVIQSLNQDYADVYHLLEAIVNENQTIFKRSSEKFLSEIFETTN